MNKVFIVVVNYTKYKDTIECLESVFKSSCQDFQVILIDNSPDDISENNIRNWLNGQNNDDIETLFPELVYPLVKKPIPYRYSKEEELNDMPGLKNERLLFVRAANKGFAAANNLAFNYILRQADESSFIWVLNNDTVIARDCLENLIGFYKNGEADAILGSKLNFYYKKEVLQAVAGRYNKWLGSTHHVGEGEIDNGQYDNFRMNPDNYIVGASMFLPFLFLKKVGLMNDDYFLYYEELDWILASKQKGFKPALQAKAIVYHKEGTSINGASFGGKNNDKSLADYYSIVNRLKFTKKWYPSCLYTVIPGVIYALLKRLGKGRFAFVNKTAKAVIKVLTTDYHRDNMNNG
jgi:GT2 family glycosyltransferase